MGKGLFDIILDSIFDADYIGRRGEKLTERELKWVQFFGRKGKVLRNLYIPKDNDETTEIDVVFITQKGIFVIESKNYSGWIFGDEKSANWTVMLPNKQKNRFYNPIKQNQTHMKWLGKYIGSNIPLFSLIVFSERCELKKVPEEQPTLRVIKRDRIYAHVRDIWENVPDVMTEEQVTELCEKLKPLTSVDEAIKAAHVERINQKYKTEKPETPVEKTPVTPDEEQRICPKCGSTLVLREAKKGKNAGNKFYGCSGYPKCRYMKAIEE